MDEDDEPDLEKLVSTRLTLSQPLSMRLTLVSLSLSR